MPRIVALWAALLLLASPVAVGETIVGEWRTIDDGSGDVRSIVEIFERDGRFHGRIKRFFPRPDEEPDPTCDRCPGDKKDHKIVGLEILWDLRRKGDGWEGGRILDPENGKVYRCKASLHDGKLKIRGFIGFSLFGRTQLWLPEG